MQFSASNAVSVDRRRALWPRASIIACLGGALWSPIAAAATSASVPSFGLAVAPILYKHCAVCHRTDGSMPTIPLESYDTAKAFASSLRQQVISRRMPPWFADSKQSMAFGNDPSLSDSQIATLISWVDGGSPRGEDRAPPWPRFPPEWSHPQNRPPDRIISLPRVRLPATGELPYVRQLLRVTEQEDRWIVGLQALPGNPAVVHHMGITEVTLAEGVTPANMGQLDAVARQLGMPAGSMTSPHPAVVDPSDPNQYDMLAIYTPGTTYESYGSGVGKLLKAGQNEYINFNIHYTTTGKSEVDESKLGLWFAPAPPIHQLLRAPMAGHTIVANGRELLTDDPGTKAEGTDVAIPPIPAYAEEYELVGITALRYPLTIYALQPHAHLRATSFHYAVVLPDGGQKTLLSVPQYDFHWQLRYQLLHPLRLPAGSKLVVTARYDNSTHNSHLLKAAAEDPSRRCGPDKLVHFRDQNQTWDEMFSPVVEYAVDRSSQDRTALARKGAQLVAATGCLTHEAGSDWSLTGVGQFEATSSQSTSSIELSALSKFPGGHLSARLIGEQPFDPAHKIGQRVAAKGLLIKDGGRVRLNLTSLQPIEGACGP